VTSPRRAALLPLFLVSAAAVGFEIALTRYFAVAKWSEYGYWVISIVMVGFALSGVVLALFRDAFARNGLWLLAALPTLLILAAAAGFHLTTTNPFNPLQLQNQATWAPQLANIAGYYGCLLPFFFLAGLYISLSFVLNAGIIGRVYGFDLTGAGAGAFATLLLMLVLHPFMLVPALLLPIAASALLTRGRWRWAGVVGALAALLAGEALLLLDNRAEINDFKAIYAPLHTPDAKVLAERRSPHGFYQLLDDFTERVDTDVSNNAGLLGVAGPPSSYGLYRDGTRIAALPKPGPVDVGYARAALDGLPYSLIQRPRVLLAGASGGFRVAELLALGARSVEALEPEPVLRDALLHGIGPSPGLGADPRVRVSGNSPVAAARAGGAFDIVDISADFLDAAEANGTAFTAEAITAYLRALAPDGIVSIPASIRDFPVYALRMLATARQGLLDAGVRDVAAHVVVYRSAWSVRVLLSKRPWTAERIAVVRRFCDVRSFDVSYYPGIDVEAARANLYNDLPAVSFDTGEMASGGPDDAIADEARAVLAGTPTASARVFNLAPITFDRPAFYAVLRLGQLDTLLRRLEILPQAEIGALVNVAVLVQAAVIAALVLLVPLLAPGRVRGEGGGLLRTILYFPALGLGFLFIEIFLIERVSFYLNDRATAFALVLTGMLIFSGLGSMAAERMKADPRTGIAVACTVILGWCGLLGLGLEPFMLATLGLPWIARAALVLVLLAPVSLALGAPFPLGLARAGSGGMLPWAWALNGAFSVVATPLANLIARELGFSRVLLSAVLLYGVAWLAFPLARNRHKWQDIPEASHVAE
jgi:MFS family permease